MASIKLSTADIAALASGNKEALAAIHARIVATTPEGKAAQLTARMNERAAHDVKWRDARKASAHLQAKARKAHDALDAATKAAEAADAMLRDTPAVKYMLSLSSELAAGENGAYVYSYDDSGKIAVLPRKSERASGERQTHNRTYYVLDAQGAIVAQGKRGDVAPMLPNLTQSEATYDTPFAEMFGNVRPNSKAKRRYTQAAVLPNGVRLPAIAWANSKGDVQTVLAVSSDDSWQADVHSVPAVTFGKATPKRKAAHRKATPAAEAHEAPAAEAPAAQDAAITEA